jgi:hypothetical protein
MLYQLARPFPGWRLLQALEDSCSLFPTGCRFCIWVVVHHTNAGIHKVSIVLRFESKSAARAPW